MLIPTALLSLALLLPQDTVYATPTTGYTTFAVRMPGMHRPRFEDGEYIMVAGGARPPIEVFRLAHVELIEWTVAISTVVATFPKRYLP